MLMDKKEIYLVCVGSYSHELVIGYYENYEEAKNFCSEHNNKNEYYNDMKYFCKKVEKL